jgi:hypothetical protein
MVRAPKGHPPASRSQSKKSLVHRQQLPSSSDQAALHKTASVQVQTNERWHLLDLPLLKSSIWPTRENTINQEKILRLGKHLQCCTRRLRTRAGSQLRVHSNGHKAA